MGYTFEAHPAAVRDLEALPGGDDERILSKLEEMVTNEFRDLLDYDVELVRGVDNRVFRARIGGYRVFFAMQGRAVGLLQVDKRAGAYRNPQVLDRRADEFRQG